MTGKTSTPSTTVDRAPVTLTPKQQATIDQVEAEQGFPLTAAQKDAVRRKQGRTTDLDAEVLRGRKALGQGLSDCAWCRWGKPAAAGAALGATVSYLSGFEVTRGALWGVAGGLLYGQLRG